MSINIMRHVDAECRAASVSLKRARDQQQQQQQQVGQAADTFPSNQSKMVNTSFFFPIYKHLYIYSLYRA